MLIAPPPNNENQRIETLLGYKVLDTDAEFCYDDLVEIASQICQTPIALVSLVDIDRQWFKARVGLDAEETPRDIAFCTHAILQDDVFIVPDATLDKRFADNPLVTEDPKIRFYAGAPLITHDGFALGTLCVIDREPKELNSGQISALKALARQVISQLELRLKTMKPDQLNTGKNKFFSMLSHDLKGPFNSILGFSNTLLNKIDTLSKENISKSAECIHHSAEQAYDLLINLLEWSRFQMGGFVFKPEKNTLKSSLTDVLLTLQNISQTKNIELVNDISDQTIVNADQLMLKSIFLNLIGNAIKFTPHGGLIKVYSQENNTGVTVCIEDNGVGIPAEKIKDMFELESFYTSAGTKGELGTGLGILLCKDFIEKHQGEIWVESKLGEGSQFYFSLPNKV